MRSLLISTISPYPKITGKQVVLGGIADYLRGVSRDGNKCKILCFDEISDNNEINFVKLSRPSSFLKLKNVFRYCAPSRRSIQEAFLWDSKNIKIIQNNIDNFEPELVVFDTIRAGQYYSFLDLRNARSVLYLDDLFSVRYKRILHAMRRFPDAELDPLGNFKQNIPKLALMLYKRAEPLRRLLLKTEMRLIRKREIELPLFFDKSLLISSDEAGILKAELGVHGDKVEVISPNVVACSRFHRNWDGRSEFVFLGNLNLAHNGFSIEWFVRNHLPKIVEVLPQFKLKIIGKNAPSSLVTAVESMKKNVELIGFVEDIRPILASAAAMIAPLLFGSGVKIKLIDALAAGLPVISTSVGAEGIQRGAGGIIVNDNFDEYPDVLRELTNAESNRFHSEAASRLFEHFYASDAVIHSYDVLFGKTASGNFDTR